MFRSRKLSLTQFIVYGAIFGAVATALLIFQLPYPIIPYLKIDLSDVITLLATIISPLLAIVVVVIKCVVALLLGQISDTIGLINVIVCSLTYIIMFILLQKVKINLIVKLIIIMIVVTIIQLLLNYYIVLPLYNGQSFSEASNSADYLRNIFVIYLPFNLIKSGVTVFVFYVVNKILERV